jgi:hypothetical protein
VKFFTSAGAAAQLIARLAMIALIFAVRRDRIRRAPAMIRQSFAPFESMTHAPAPETR